MYNDVFFLCWKLVVSAIWRFPLDSSPTKKEHILPMIIQAMVSHKRKDLKCLYRCLKLDCNLKLKQNVWLQYMLLHYIVITSISYWLEHYASNILRLGLEDCTSRENLPDFLRYRSTENNTGIKILENFVYSWSWNQPTFHGIVQPKFPLGCVLAPIARLSSMQPVLVIL